MWVESVWLEDAEKQLIIDAAYDILERVGVCLKGSRSLTLLADAGARVDQHSGIVRIPSEIISGALACCPREILMAGSAPEFDVELGADSEPRFCTGGCAARTLDPETGVARPSTLADLRDAVALCDELTEVALIFTPVTATDVPLERRELVEYATLFEQSGKHQILVDCPRRADALRHIAELLSGDLDRFRARPRFTSLCTVTSPLQIDGLLLDFHAGLAALGAPVGIFPAPVMGGTGPVSVAGSVALALAEFLGAASAIQLMAPGARLLMGSIGSLLDMRTGTATFAAPEAVVASAIGASVAHYLGLPVQCAGLATSAHCAGTQAGYEKAIKGFATVLAGADLVSGGIGLLDSGNLFSLPQVLIDAEIAATVLRVARGASITPRSVMVESVERVGVGGNFLTQRETRQWARAGEQFMPLLGTRLSYGAWVRRGCSELDAASHHVRALLRAHEQKDPYLDEDQRREMSRIAALPESD